MCKENVCACKENVYACKENVCVCKENVCVCERRMYVCVRRMYCYMLDVLWHCQEVPGLNVLCLIRGQQRSPKGGSIFAPFH